MSLRDREIENWAHMPDELKTRAIQHLRTNLHPDAQKEIRDLIARGGDDWMTPYHFSTGMALRNLLRGVIADDELPPVDYDGMPMQNWDDYYVMAVEAAVATPLIGDD